MKNLALFAATLILLPSCAVDLVANADAIATPSGLKRTQINAGEFVLTAYVKNSGPSDEWNIYIEGDGMAWLNYNEPSLDPTPHKAVGLSLAASDKAPNVAYIARPCQFTPAAKNPRCEVAFWTDKRFSEEVIASMNAAINKITGSNRGQKVNLVGYSGGGAVAILAAAKRDDVKSIRTVSGNLDHRELNRLHDVSQMPGSLNAIDKAKAVSNIPQIHFSGSEDKIVPSSIAERYRAASPTTCVKTKTIAGASHDNGWKERWPELLAVEPKCE